MMTEEPPEDYPARLTWYHPAVLKDINDAWFGGFIAGVAMAAALAGVFAVLAATVRP